MFFLILIAFSGCFRINHLTYLKLKDGSDISLYQRDSAWIEIWGSMKEWNNYIIENSNWLKDSNFVKFEIRTKDINFIKVNLFSVKLWHIHNNHSTPIDDGKIYYGSYWQFDDYHPNQDMRDAFEDYTYVSPSGRFGILLVVKSKPSIEIEQADSFVIDVFLDCVIDSEAMIIHKVDTLYKDKKTRKGFSVH